MRTSDLGGIFLASFLTIALLAPAARAAEPAGPPGEATDSPEAGAKDRLDRLEGELARTRRELEELKREQAQGTSTAAEGEEFEKNWGKEAIVTWRDGFQLLFLDEKEEDPTKVIHSFRVGGRLHVDYRWFADEAHPQDDTFLLRRAYLQASGTFYRWIDWVVEADFADSPSVAVKDAFVDFFYLKPLRMRLGHFKMPMSIEQLCSDNFINFVERPLLVSILSIDRDLGAMVHGDLGFLNYMVAVQNGNKTGNVKDNNDDKDIALRLALTPFKPQKSGILENLEVAASYSYGHEDDFVPSFNTCAGTNYLSLAVPATGRKQRGYRQRAGAELTLPAGPFRIQSEYAFMRVDDIAFSSGRPAPLEVGAWYVDLLFMVTGETRLAAKRMIPARNFDPFGGGFGALEFGVRFEQVELPDAVRRRAAGRGTDNVDALTLGLNWYLNPNMRFMVNFCRAWFDDKVEIASQTRSRLENEEDVFLFRFQIDF